MFRFVFILYDENKLKSQNDTFSNLRHLNSGHNLRDLTITSLNKNSAMKSFILAIGLVAA